MPELPDVEIFRRYLDYTSLHKTIEKCRVLDEDILEDVSKEKLQRVLKNNQFTESRRHGKHLLVHMKNSDWLTLHFGMTGFLKYFKKEESRPDHLRMVIDFTNGYHLGYDAMRKLGHVGLTRNPESFAENKNLGVDALDENLTFDIFKKIASETKSSLKSFLMRQDMLCGIGNIYSDEICFQAGLHPKKKVDALDEKQLKTLFGTMQDVLETAIESGADPEKFPDAYLIPHRSKDSKCPRCGARVRQVKISGRTAYYCPECQN